MVSEYWALVAGFTGREAYGVRRLARAPKVQPVPAATPQLFLIDGNSLVYRAFFALPESIATSTGRPTNAIFGFASMLVKILTDYGQQPTIVVWDAGSSGRKEVYPDYKGHRPSRPDLLAEQWPHMEPLVDAFGYRNLSLPGYEADDVIASLARQAGEKQVSVMIVTGDRDAFQLIDDGHVKVMATSRGITETKIYDRQAVIDRYGIPPERIPDFHGLKGETSDNIPGVPGIGDKTASDLLQRFGDVEGVLASIDQISGAKRKQNLTEHAEAARISKQLATLRRDLDTGVDVTAEAAREPDRSRLREVFREFELRDPLRRLEEALGSADAAAPPPSAPSQLTARVRSGNPFPGGRPGGEESCRWRSAPPSRPRTSCSPRAPGASPWRPVTGRSCAGTASGRRTLAQAGGRRPVVVHDAKALGAVPANLAHDTLVAAYLLDPAGRAYPLDELCADRALSADIEDPSGSGRRAHRRAGRVAARGDRRARARAPAA